MTLDETDKKILRLLQENAHLTLKEIAKQESCICGEIVSVLPLAQSTVSQHLKELLKAGLITGSVDGAKSCYCINWKTFELFEKQFSEFFAKTNTNNPKCC